MKQNLNIEAEGSELILKNKAGDHVIIPKKYREEVKGMIKDNCHGCIDSLVETLPVMSDYAEDGTVYPKEKYNSEKEYNYSLSDMVTSNKIKSKEELLKTYIDKAPSQQQDVLNLTDVKQKQDAQIFKNTQIKDLESLSEDDFRDKYQTSKHRFKYDTDESYKKEKQETAKSLKDSVGTIDYPKTNMLSKNYIGNTNLQFMNPSGLIGESAKDNEEFHMGLISSVLPIPGINQMGKVKGLENVFGKITKVGSKADDVAKVVNKVEVPKGNLSNLSKLKQTHLDYNIDDLIKGISITDKKNLTIIGEGNKYYKELNNPESLKRLKEFGDEYQIDLLDTYKKAEERWDYAANVGKHSKFQVAGDEVFKDDIVNAMGVSTYNTEGIMKSFLSKDKNLSKAEKDLSNHSVNYINKKADIADYHNIVWHELSHDINKTIIGESPKLQQEIKEIFKSNLNDISENTLKETKEITDKLYKSNLKTQNNSVNKTLKERAVDEINYVSKPTETWAFLSTNLRQDLKKTGLIKSYNEILTAETLNKAIKNKNTVFSRFEPYIADKDKFIKLFNKMTLAIAPATLYFQSQQNNKTKQ